MKTIKLYSVLEDGNILTIVKEKKQAYAYAKKYLMSKNFAHFEAWCKLRNLTMNDDSWNLYFAMCDIPNDLEIRWGKVNVDCLISSYRTVVGCLPLGLPWEFKEEMNIFLNSLPQEALEELDTLVEELPQEK